MKPTTQLTAEKLIEQLEQNCNSILYIARCSPDAGKLYEDKEEHLRFIFKFEEGGTSYLLNELRELSGETCCQEEVLLTLSDMTTYWNSLKEEDAQDDPEMVVNYLERFLNDLDNLKIYF